ncbi:hypothetical protein BD770DRAFT_415722 [Pilaira anomala]|nr:hypothetical protein BD770DRAFT_415722 [Pilaira anomala]
MISSKTPQVMNKVPETTQAKTLTTFGKKLAWIKAFIRRKTLSLTPRQLSRQTRSFKNIYKKDFVNTFLHCYNILGEQPSWKDYGSRKDYDLDIIIATEKTPNKKEKRKQKAATDNEKRKRLEIVLLESRVISVFSGKMLNTQAFANCEVKAIRTCPGKCFEYASQEFIDLIEDNKVKQEDLIIEKRMHEFARQEIHSALDIVEGSLTHTLKDLISLFYQHKDDNFNLKKHNFLK